MFICLQMYHRHQQCHRVIITLHLDQDHHMQPLHLTWALLTFHVVCLRLDMVSRVHMIWCVCLSACVSFIVIYFLKGCHHPLLNIIITVIMEVLIVATLLSRYEKYCSQDMFITIMAIATRPSP